MKPNLMIQGTASSVGKSLLTAGICRMLCKDGYKTAPFKSQNMALNSFSTYEGLEMGRAQAMQAEAAGIQPEVGMNPILLKPESNTGSQVIVLGKAIGRREAGEYYEKKEELRQVIVDSYKDIENRYDAVVIEGAGSPAEINLNKNDFVNMGMAAIADAPVILVGDIDRGGVFASIVGTLFLLPPADRDRVKGIIINKFRGDIRLLESGLRDLEKIINIPVLGVIPYFDNRIDDEDSLAVRLSVNEKTDKDLDVCVIKLPHVSNFTDFTPLEIQPDVTLRYIKSPQDFGTPDIVIIPGSKSTASDLDFLKQTGLDGKIKTFHTNGGHIIGICGGLQILGQEIADPDHVESEVDSTPGLGLLDIKTVFRKTKITIQTEHIFNIETPFTHGLAGKKISGYEIHCGESEALPSGIAAPHEREITFADGRIFATYLHGVFDDGVVLNYILNNVRKSKGLQPIENRPSYKEYKESEYDRLEKTVRENIDTKKLYDIIFRR